MRTSQTRLLGSTSFRLALYAHLADSLLFGCGQGLARLYPFEMVRKYDNPGNLSIHYVFKLSSLDW
jgi:hypothetical protein